MCSIVVVFKAILSRKMHLWWNHWWSTSWSC